MVLNAAYLVEDAAQLRARVAELQERHAALGARIDLTGPWPPYNFVTERRGRAAGMTNASPSRTSRWSTSSTACLAAAW